MFKGSWKTLAWGLEKTGLGVGKNIKEVGKNIKDDWKF